MFTINLGWSFYTKYGIILLIMTKKGSYHEVIKTIIIHCACL